MNELVLNLNPMLKQTHPNQWMCDTPFHYFNLFLTHDEEIWWSHDTKFCMIIILRFIQSSRKIVLCTQKCLLT